MSHKILSPFFALLIFVAHLNCVVEHQLIGETAKVDSIEKSTTAEVPVNRPVHEHSDACDHGCICKGATLANSFLFEQSDVESFCVQFFATEPFCLSFERPESSSDKSPRNTLGGSPLRALERCALLQTFLI